MPESTTAGPRPTSPGAATENATIRPFRVEVPEEDLAELRRRIDATRWPERETVDDDSQGVPLATMQELARYWATEYDWRKCEARLNALPQFMTEIDGLDIHFVHVRSKHEDALPLVVCHGWPGSPVEQLKLIGPLTDPTAHGASASDAFHLVIPSMPGHGFSGKPIDPGWDPVHIGKAYVELMRRLGYTRFVAQGGDWGAVVVDVMAGGRDPGPAEPAPPQLIGIHTNMAGAIPPDIYTAAFTGSPPPSGLSDEERSTYQQLRTFFATHVAYGLIMATRPQTLYGLADSPIDLAAFMLDHGDGTGQPGLVQQVLKGRLEKPSDLTRDDILDNITLYWLTNSGISSARLYWAFKGGFFTAKGVTIPVGVSTFADELYRVPRSWAEQAYLNLVYYNQHDRGGHFAAWEQPQLLSEDVRATFRSLRTNGGSS
jgi:pimeloyl-ACP methyl ester carboxylesterase